ncbi:hypothetical protein F5884DRAFT_674608 [Xylogone sp. PMI_703]|nr:hypothetical protein F5884DRAFT_674608 [Xylogone sp. PMI_703]
MSPFPSATLAHPSVAIEQNNTSTATNASTHALQVICAWPVSGQYGPGSRVLYYVLIATCVIARKAEWLRKACLAAALLFPAVAALHAIVLSAVHVDGAVDMDVFGAFQLCSIGILAGPITARLSRTYFIAPGRDIIYLWTGLILAGLLSLTVEFFRINTSPCPRDDHGNPISRDPHKFPYGTTCGLTCTIEEGPHSPLRGGSTNNIYVIPAPHRLTFDTATLLGAACCLPAILTLISMWTKILEINWKSRFGTTDEDDHVGGVEDNTIKKAKGVNEYISTFLAEAQILVFGAAVLAILVIGERNFFSPQVRYETEPMASIGQWAPIVGTGLAALGSLYLLLAADIAAAKKAANEEEKSNRTSSPPPLDMHRRSTVSDRGSFTEIEVAARRTNSGYSKASTVARTDPGGRIKVAKMLMDLSSFFGNPRRDLFDDSKFKHGPASDFPEVPGERNRNGSLLDIKRNYNTNPDVEGNGSPSVRPRSSISSINSIVILEDSSKKPAQRPRRDTLEVPPLTHHGSIRSSTSVTCTPAIIMPEDQNSPTIVVSSDADSETFPIALTHSEPSKPPAALFKESANHSP